MRDVLLSELCLSVEAPAQSVSLLPQLRQHSMAELAVEQELLARLLEVCRRLLAGLEGHAPLPLDVLLRELLRVVDAGLVVRRGEDVPGLQVLRVDLRGPLAVIDYLLVVSIFELLNVLVGLHVLELPEAELVVADAQQLWLDIFRLLE